MKEITIKTVGGFADQWKKYIKPLILKGLSGGEVSLQIGRPSKTRLQESKYHAMIADICSTATIKINGVIVDTSNYDAVKALLVVWFEYEKNEMGESLRRPSQTIVDPKTCEKITVRASTKQFNAKESSEFIEFLYKIGTEYGTTFSEKVTRYDEYPELGKVTNNEQ